MRNKLSAADFNALIEEFKNCNFEVGDHVWKCFKEGVNPETDIPLHTQQAILTQVQTKWENQSRKKRFDYKKQMNSGLKWEDVPDIRIWKLIEAKVMVKNLGFIDSYTGIVLVPDTFCF